MSLLSSGQSDERIPATSVDELLRAVRIGLDQLEVELQQANLDIVECEARLAAVVDLHPGDGRVIAARTAIEGVAVGSQEHLDKALDAARAHAAARDRRRGSRGALDRPGGPRGDRRRPRRAPAGSTSHCRRRRAPAALPVAASHAELTSWATPPAEDLARRTHPLEPGLPPAAPAPAALEPEVQSAAELAFWAEATAAEPERGGGVDVALTRGVGGARAGDPDRPPPLDRVMASATTVYVPPPVDQPMPTPRPLVQSRDRGDRIFRSGSLGTGVVVLAIMAGVGLFLSIEAWDALSQDRRLVPHHRRVAAGPRRVRHRRRAHSARSLIALVAVAVALPISMGTALFITEVAPPRLRSTLHRDGRPDGRGAERRLRPVGPVLLPGPRRRPVALDLDRGSAGSRSSTSTGADPNNPLPNATVYTASTFIAGIVVALMVMPIQCSIMREVFSQVPIGEREGAFALGSTRWGMIRIVSLPFGRGGIIGGTMLGLGRALGETIAVYLIISPRFDINFHMLEAGGRTRCRASSPCASARRRASACRR